MIMITPIKDFLKDSNFYLGKTEQSARFYFDNKDRIFEFAYLIAKELRFYSLTIPNFLKLFEKLLKDSDNSFDLLLNCHRDSGDSLF